jgi:hypothetical protein
MLLHELLQNECRHRLGYQETELDPFPYFVEPMVDGNPALRSLGAWLVSDPSLASDGYDQNVAILLAPAGVGKTQVSRELFRLLHQRRQRDVLPLLIEPDQWLTLNRNEHISTWSLVKHACEQNGYNALPQESFAVYAQNGCIIVIFDGLDEIGSLGTDITPVDVIRLYASLH